MKYRFLFAAIAIAMGLLCVRLGLWQLDRRTERRAHNANVAARAIQPAQDLATLRGDTSELRYRRARITGVADYSQELILGNRSRSAAPGINLLTPVRIPGRDTAVLVNRGWVYSPDAATPPDGSWREQDTVTFEGYVDILAAGDAAPANPRRPRLVPRATYASVAARLPYPVAGIYLVALLPEDSAPTGVPVRVAMPQVTDEGPHLGYAFQWFIFATIAFVGAGIALRAGRPPARQPSTR